MKKENRFPLELDLEGARKIIDVACNDWKDKLSKKWCSLMNPDEVAIFINESFYKEMRAACNDEQHKVLDEVFGKDERSVEKALIDILQYNESEFSEIRRNIPISGDINFSDVCENILETFDIKFKE